MTKAGPGPGWWQASDGRWYSPDQHPDEAYRAQWAAVAGEDLHATVADSGPPQAPPPGPAAPPPGPAAPPPGPTPEEEPSASSRVPMLAGIVALVVVVLGAAVWFLVLSGDDDDGDDGEVATATDTTPDTGDGEPVTTAPDDGGNDEPAEPAVEEVRSDLLLVFEAQPGVSLDSHQDAELIGIQYGLVLDGSGMPERISGEILELAEGPGGQPSFGPDEPDETPVADLVAPDGYEFVVARVDLTLAPRGEAPRASVNVDGVRRSIDLASGAQSVVFLAPDDAEVVAMDVQDDYTEQSLSLLDGERLEQVDVLYRSESSRRVAVNSSMVLAFSGSRFANDDTGDYELDLGFGNASLVWLPSLSEVWPRDATPAGQPSNSDRAWLVVEMSRYQTAPNLRLSWNPRIPGTEIVLVLDDDSEVVTPLSNLTGEHPLIFEVAADFTEGRIEIRPGDGITNNEGGTYNFGGAVGSVDVRFPDPGN